MRGKVAVGLSTLLLILLPAGGFIVGGYATGGWPEPDGPVCGLYVFPAMIEAGATALAGAVVGLAAGLGVGWVLTLGLFRWANRCGLGEIRDDLPTA